MSSFLQNIVSTDFRVHGQQAVIGASQQMARGMGNVMRSVDDLSRRSTVLNAQWRAIGTTIRYALAGQAVFGLTSVIGQLKDFQQQMGLISAIGEKGSTGTPLVGQDLTKLQAQIRVGSMDALTPVNEFTKGVLNLLSSVQGVPENEIVPIMTDISKAATLAQISTEDATKAFTTMNTAFGRAPNRKNIQDMAQQFFILTQQAPGGAAAGQQIVTQLGQMAQVTRVAGGRPQDMFSLLLTVLRSGIPPAQAGRGVQFFLQTLGLPGQQVKPSKDALASVGILPGSNMTLQERMSRVFTRARALGLSDTDRQKILGMDEESMSQFEDDSPGALASQGITGRGAEFLGQIFRRIHALRTALAYGQQIGPGDTQKAEEDLKMMNDAMNGTVSDINDLNEAFQRFEDRAVLQKAAIAVDVMRNRVGEIFAPVLNFAANEILTPAMKKAIAHPDATRNAIIGAGGLAAGYGVLRMFRTRSIGPLGGALGAVQGVRSIGNAPTGSLDNPFFVYVLSSFGGTGPGFGRGRVNPTSPTHGIPERDMRTPQTRTERLGTRARAPSTRTAGRYGVAALLTTLIGGDMMYQFDQENLSDRYRQYSGKQGFGELYRDVKKKFGGSGIDMVRGLFGGGGDDDDKKKAVQRQDEIARANELWGKQVRGTITRVSDEKMTNPFTKNAGLSLTIHVKHPDGTEEDKKVHIPWKTFQNGKSPSFQGNPGGRK